MHSILCPCLAPLMAVEALHYHVRLISSSLSRTTPCICESIAAHRTASVDMIHVRNAECHHTVLAQPPLSLPCSAHLHTRPGLERLQHIMPQPIPSTSGRNACLGVKRRASVTAALVAERPLSQDVSKTVDVPLGDRSYPIYIGEGLLDRGELLQQHVPGKRVLIVTNETIAPLYLERYVAKWGVPSFGLS